MPDNDIIASQKSFDDAIETVQTFQQGFDRGRWGLATLSYFSFSAVFRSISYARMYPDLQSRKTDVVFDHFFFVSDIPNQVQLNTELRHAAYKAGIYSLIQAFFVYSNETARRPELLEKIETLLGDYCAEADVPRHPFFNQLNDDWRHRELTEEQRTSYLALLSFTCYFSAPILYFDEKGIFDEPVEERFIDLSLLEVSRVGSVVTAHLQKLSSGVRDAFLDCLAEHLADPTLPLHFLGQRLYNDGRGILNAEQKFKILSNLIPVIEAIKQQHPSLKASKYSTIEDEFSDRRILGARKEKRLLRLFRDLEIYKTDFKELDRHLSKALNPVDLPRAPSEPGIEMVSLATRLAGLFSYTASPTESSDDGSSDDENAPLYPEGLRQRRQPSISSQS